MRHLKTVCFEICLLASKIGENEQVNTSLSIFMIMFREENVYKSLILCLWFYFTHDESQHICKTKEININSV